MSDDRILTLSEAAEMIRVSTRTMGDMARRHRVPARKVGREWRFLQSALEEWLARAPVVADQRGPGGPKVAEPQEQYELSLAGFGDTAFADNRQRRLHRWVPWVAGFSGSFVTGVLNKISTDGESLRVLDPFAGVGTTLVEAMKTGHDAVGFEINPYAALACRVKTSVAFYDVEDLADAIERFGDHTDAEPQNNMRPSLRPPSGFRSRVRFFSPNVESQVLACLEFIGNERTEWIREIFQLAFGAVMVGFSNYSYEPTLGTRAGAGKPDIKDADVSGIVKKKLRDMYDDIVAYQRDFGSPRPLAAAVHPLSYMKHAGRVAPASIDLIITSPPYLNNYHYIRNTRPQLYWLGLVERAADLKAIERHSFGQFWQTVRTGPELPLMPGLAHLNNQIKELRHRNVEKGAYGGPGWANYATSYFNDCQDFCRISKTLMRPGGSVVVVIGNNILQGIEFKTDKIFAEIAEAEGFEIVDIHLVRSKRTGNSVVNSPVRVGKVSERIRLYETAVELRAPRTSN